MPMPNALLLPNAAFHPIPTQYLKLTMDHSYSAVEKRIQAACKAANAEKKPNFAALARQYSVSVYRLRARFELEFRKE